MKLYPYFITPQLLLYKLFDEFKKAKDKPTAFAIFESLKLWIHHYIDQQLFMNDKRGEEVLKQHLCIMKQFLDFVDKQLIKHDYFPFKLHGILLKAKCHKEIITALEKKKKFTFPTRVVHTPVSILIYC